MVKIDFIVASLYLKLFQQKRGPRVDNDDEDDDAYDLGGDEGGKIKKKKVGIVLNCIVLFQN